MSEGLVSTAQIPGVGAEEVHLQDVRHALLELGGPRFEEMRVRGEIRKIARLTRSMFAIDGAGPMLATHLGVCLAAFPHVWRRFLRAVVCSSRLFC